MEKRIFLICFTAVFTATVYAQQFLYPIAQLDDETMLLMHQKTSDDLELLVWNPHTKIARKELTSLYIPAYVQLLPSKTAYSFLDRGRIRIKSFQKRAPRTLDIFQPICDIQSLHWITDEQCYFVAKYREYYKIFMYDISVDGGLLYCLTNLDDAINYIFPSKVDQSLFCLIQSESGLYTVGQLPWKPVLFDDVRKSTDSTIFNGAESIIEHDHPLCFLSMQTDRNGFVLELLEKDIHKEIFKFGCCSLNFDGTEWSTKHLFEIILPEHLVIGYQSERLYESIYPLLPKYSSQSIYFTNYDLQDCQCRIYQYDIATGKIEMSHQQTRSSRAYQHIFAPLISNDCVYTGCSFNFCDTHRSALQVNENNGIMTCDIPIILKNKNHESFQI